MKTIHQKGLLEQIKEVKFFLLSPDSRKLLTTSLKAQVSSQVAVRSHMVCTEDGILYRRNRSHLYKVPKNFQGMSDEDKVQSKVDTQIRPPARKPNERIPQLRTKPSALQMRAASQPGPGQFCQVFPLLLLNLQSSCSQILSLLHQVFPYLSLLEVADLGGLRTWGILLPRKHLNILVSVEPFQVSSTFSVSCCCVACSFKEGRCNDVAIASMDLRSTMRTGILDACILVMFCTFTIVHLQL